MCLVTTLIHILGDKPFMSVSNLQISSSNYISFYPKYHENVLKL